MTGTFLRLLCSVLAVSLTMAILVSSADAQLFRRRRAVALPPAEAIAGQPFGVGRVSVPLPDARASFFGERPLFVTERNRRVFYSAIDDQPVRAALRDLLNRPQTATVYFLFVGEEPLELEIAAAGSVRMQLVPRRDPVAHDGLLQAWWAEYTGAAQNGARTSEYPQLVDDYLVAMLSNRLRLEPGRLARTAFGREDLDLAFGTLLGAESLRLQLQNELMLTDRYGQQATEPLPRPIEFPPKPVPELLEEVEIEPIALHVPEECFYIRFGTFPNYLWFRRVLEDYGGNLRNMVTLRGLDYSVSPRLQQQLVLRESALAPVLGPQVIRDVALIGTDMFMREGASFGILFHAQGAFGLASDIKSQRGTALEKHKDIEETILDIDGHSVSFLSTPDNRVRSFYAVDGDFHLVTTSRTIVRRFFEAGADKQSLGRSPEFRLARARRGLDRDDTVFAYLSREFLQNLTTPHYRIEMQRRVRSAVEIDLVRMARFAARNEGYKNDTLSQLIRNGFLSADVGVRPEGSELVVENGDGDVMRDSVRGEEGFFTPIADISFDKVTAAEAREYRRFVTLAQSEWGQLDPIVLSAKRYAGPGENREYVSLDVLVAPFAAENYRRLTRYAGPPSEDRMAPIRGNVVTAEGVTLGERGEVVHVYGGVVDTDLRFEFGEGLLGSLRTMLNLKYYYGGWPSVGPLVWMGLRDNLPTDPEGFARASSRLWQRFNGPFITGSTDPRVLELVTPQFRIVPADRPAQLWLEVGDIVQSDLIKLANGFGYFRARQVTAGNLQFLHRLTAQLGVPPDQARQVAERLVHAKLVCALGGDLELVRNEAGRPVWRSTAWDRTASRLITEVPPDFLTPPLDWFRGLNADATLTERELSLRAVVDMQRKPRPQEIKPIELPSFPFKAWNWLGGGQGKPDAAAKDAAPKEPPPKPTDAPKAEELPEPTE